ncbi:DUF2515 family protein [Aquibacillus kalidii]|uniref:DUF2515 family protein n=1 Tax=Aquibacillus kalidii TaxID=2762597 RepID=UPI0016495D44|nr:DUF2515 family protein [Aquibacillus kalidii]
MLTEQDLIAYINKSTERANIDNISRTKAYQYFYLEFPEIEWSFLASMVSRNAGWNITDMHSPMFKRMLNHRIRKQLFSTYERANWLIFSDAYPQLLLYQLSCEVQKPLFHLLRHFSVSTFMEQEWLHFWQSRDKDRLVNALIINEQNVIQGPVTKHPFYKYRIFMNWPYLMQDILKMSAVLFPTRSGYIYAVTVHDFSNLTKRIRLGKQLANILFNPIYYKDFLDFAIHTEHTGSRNDYLRYLPHSDAKDSPILRFVYPVIEHQDNIRKDWYLRGGVKKRWWKKEHNPKNIWNGFNKKRKLIQTLSKLM